MFCRGRLFIIFVIVTLSFLLIIAIAQFTNNAHYRKIAVNRRNVRTSQTNDKRVEALLPPKTSFVTYDSAKILDKARRKIRNDLWNYNFKLSGVKYLGDLTMESGGHPLRSLIVSTWRSGSTFFGELLNSVPGNYYHYEPFSSNKINQIRGPPVADKAVKTIKNMFKCTYDGMNEYFDYGRNYLHQFRHNTRLWEHCKSNNDLCFNANFTGQMCKLFPFHSMKVVRFRLRLVKEILDDKQLNIKVILLIRDPRGVKQSRRFCNFCRPAPDCWNPERICADMISDYVAAGRLLKQYPERIMVLRYEDLALNLRTTTDKVMKFLGLTSMKSTEDFLYTHTKEEVAGVTSTYRVTSDVPFKWKRVLDFAYIDEIQMACYEAMDLWGYTIAQNASHMASKDFFPLEPYTI